MIIHMTREADTASVEAQPGVPAFRVSATPFEDAEAEVRRRVLRALANRVNPPTAVVFVRTWELAAAAAPPTEPEPAPALKRRGAPKR